MNFKYSRSPTPEHRRHEIFSPIPVIIGIVLIVIVCVATFKAMSPTYQDDITQSTTSEISDQ